jgi:hypothetical protein
MPELGAIERIDNLRALRRFGDAEHLIRTALATEPQDALLLWRLSAVLLGTERVAEGLQAAKAALAADPQDPDAHRLHALLLTASNRHQEATHAGYAAVTLAPQHAHTVTVYAHVLRCAGRSAAAVARDALSSSRRTIPRYTWKSVTARCRRVIVAPRAPLTKTSCGSIRNTRRRGGTSRPWIS